MGLSNGYGVLDGTLTGHFRDTPDNQGRWYHVHLDIDAAGLHYEAAVDVDSHAAATGVQWKVVDVSDAGLRLPSGLATGFNHLANSLAGGALDHIRKPETATLRFLPIRFVVRFPFILGWRRRWWRSLLRIVYRPWTSGDHIQATAALESILTVGRRTLVWGEPFTTGLGVHNVHQNQGDPAGSSWSGENAIWQDGGVGVQQLDGSWQLFISKFSSQSSYTDTAGHPI